MMVDVDRHGPFRLGKDFLDEYRNRPVEWGFGALSWITFQRTYSRKGEAWWETCRRVVEGMLTVERIHCLERGLEWDEGRARDFAREAYARMFSFRWTPPGRGLWIMGTRFMYERGGAALNNCGFVSTGDLARDYAAPFVWMLRMAMLGVGVGFDTRGAGTVKITEPRREAEPHGVADSREGWGDALRKLLAAYVGADALPSRWDLSRLRPRGAPLESFGGVASGPEPLDRLLTSLQELYREYVGRKADTRLIVDTMNLVGRCVVAGGIRRSAQIAFGEPNDLQFLDLKEDPEKVESHRWVSNNSILARVGMAYDEVARRTAGNGEPGYLWLENVRSRGRIHSDRLRVPRSIKLTSVKPSGTVSLLAGATPGVHWDHAPYYIRRLRISENNPLVDMCREAGYEVEEDRYADRTMVVSFPIHVENMARRKAQVSLREKVDLAAQMQRFWSDNQVSCTAEFNPENEEEDVPRVLRAYEDRLKALVFLPSESHGYEQPPYEAMDADTYREMVEALKPLKGQVRHEQQFEAGFCEGGACDMG